MPPARQPAPYPEQVGPYELLIPVASGGMATVYLARRRGVGGFERHVALKLTHPHLRLQDEFVGGVIEEAKLAARIRHPNVAQVLDVGDDPHGVYLVMEYFEGDTVAGLMRAASESGSTIPLAIALRILSDALSGLHAAHELRAEGGSLANLVHRDVSPQNVLVGTDGAARLIDFGIAKTVDRCGLTKSGVIKGKLPYMAPEQIRGAALDRRADVWAAGVVAWELFAGRRLHSGEEAEIVLRTLSEEPAPLRSVRPELPEALESAVASALRIDVSERCPTASELRDRIVRAAFGFAPVAEPETVARYVATVAGPMLQARREELAASLDRPRPRPAEGAQPLPTKRRRVGPFVGVGLGVAASAAIAIGVSMRAPRSVSSAAPPAAAAPTTSTWSGPPAPALAAEPAAPQVSKAAPAPPATERDLSIAANAAIARLVVDGVVIDVRPASTGVTIPLPDSSRGDVRLEAFAADGRVKRQLVTHGARSVTLVFAPARAAHHVTGATSAVLAAPATHAAPQKPKLQENPYSE